MAAIEIRRRTGTGLSDVGLTGEMLDAAAATRLFSDRGGHVPVPLHRLDQARLLWLNERAARQDPQFHRLDADLQAYGRQLLACCAFVIDASQPTRTAAIGHADRYGGTGIGHNGGSGRNVFVNGYMVKGVGRTPLVSSRAPEAHASGGAYLEECVRETIFSEVVAAEFPHGAVPTLAIIDTGLVQVWNTALGPKRERRTLLVRPAFLRPAHFERAIGFASGRQFEGADDHERVLAMFGGAIEVFGKDGLRQRFEALWERWAHQLAYAFVHRLPHGSNTTSNIAFDGRLADFGAMTAVPSWANAATVLTADPFETRFASVEHALRSLSYYFGRHFDPTLGEPRAIEARVARCRRVFERCVTLEVLRLCGVPDPVAAEAVESRRGDALWRNIRRRIAHYQAERIDLVERVELPRLPWDLHRVWEERGPAHLSALRSVLLDLVRTGRREAAAKTCSMRCASRTLLYAPEAKEDIYARLERDPGADPRADVTRIVRLLESTVRASRRDFREAGAEGPH